VKRAGVSRPTFYQHFTDVPDLVRVATLQRLGELFDRMPSVPHGDSWDDFARARLTLLLGELQRDAAIYLPILRGPAAVPVLAGIIHYLAGQFLHQSPLAPRLREGVDEREALARAEFLGAGAVWRAIAWLSSDFMGENALVPTVQRFAANIFAASGVTNYSTTDSTK
jgi:AcrR family transcriptional regulator